MILQEKEAKNIINKIIRSPVFKELFLLIEEELSYYIKEIREKKQRIKKECSLNRN